MSRTSRILIILLLFFVPFWYSFTRFQAQKSFPVLPPQSLPAPILKIISGGHAQAMAQNLFFKTMFYNEVRAEQGYHQIDNKTNLNLLDIATQLDPYNMDCYYYAQALLADQPNSVRPLNTMLLRGTKYRSWDHYPPWFLGCNYYYTLQDKKKAGEYFSEAARRRPDVVFFATFAARSLHEGSETQMAVQVLREMLQQANSPLIAEPIKNRLLAFETVIFLRQALERYSKQFKKPAQKLDDLVDDHILKAIPPDPYGGQFYLNKNGAVQTTSNFAMKKE